MMTLSVVSHDQRDLVARLLTDLVDVDADLITSIVVTRNVPEAPIDIPAPLLGKVVVVDNPAPLGFGANHNAAFARCATPLFTILNPDIRIVADPFRAIATMFEVDAATMRDDGRLALVAPHIRAPDGRLEDAARKLITPWSLIARRLTARGRRPAADFDWLAGMFMVVRSDAFREVGGFDERYFLYCEDFDLCARLRLADWRFAIAESVSAIHAAQRASHRSVRHLSWHFVSLYRMWTSSAFWRYRRALAGPLR